MKLIVAVVQDRDGDPAVKALNEKGYRVTRIGTTGGFLQQGNTTLLIGVDDNAVQNVTALLKTVCRRREIFMPVAVSGSDQAFALSNHIGVEVGGATVFVMDVDSFEQI